jgi:hypothetical protein
MHGDVSRAEIRARNRSKVTPAVFTFSGTIFMLGFCDSVKPFCFLRTAEKPIHLMSCMSDPVPVACGLRRSFAPVR